jgi:hypothetical protein
MIPRLSWGCLFQILTFLSNNYLELYVVSFQYSSACCIPGQWASSQYLSHQTAWVVDSNRCSTRRILLAALLNSTCVLTKSVSPIELVPFSLFLVLTGLL